MDVQDGSFVLVLYMYLIMSLAMFVNAMYTAHQKHDDSTRIAVVVGMFSIVWPLVLIAGIVEDLAKDFYNGRKSE